jgi:hypothetical protein
MKTPDKFPVTTVTMTFKGIETIKEIYKMHVKEVQQTLAMLDNGDIDALQSARNELKEMLAIVENKMSVSRGYKLSQVENPGKGE